VHIASKRVSSEWPEKLRGGSLAYRSAGVIAPEDDIEVALESMASLLAEFSLRRGFISPFVQN
jgi:hypothetical protein